MSNLSKTKTQPKCYSSSSSSSSTSISTKAASVDVKQFTPFSDLAVYSSSAHMRQHYPAGTTSVTIPKSTDIASIVALTHDGIILPFSFVGEPNVRAGLTDRFTGEKVTVQVQKGGKMFEGKIISLGEGEVTLLQGGIIEIIRKYDSIQFQSNVELSRPSLVFANVKAPFILSYHLSDISWECMGTAIISEVNNTLYLRLSGYITNSSESDIKANTTLISGNVFQSFRHSQETYAQESRYMSKASMAAAPMRGEHPSPVALEDFMRYEVGERIIHTKDVAELGVSSHQVEKVYIFLTSESERTSFGYRFVTDAYIPACNVNAYAMTTEENIGPFIGSSNLKERQKGDKAYLILGKSTTVQCISNVSVVSTKIEDEKRANSLGLKEEYYSRYKKWQLLTETIKVEIHNRNNKEVTLKIKHPIYDRYLVRVDCANTSQKEGHLTWEMKLSAQAKETFTCVVVTATGQDRSY